MKSFFQPEVYQELEVRLEKIKPDSQPLWGKINAGQMMNHCQ